MVATINFAFEKSHAKELITKKCIATHKHMQLNIKHFI